MYLIFSTKRDWEGGTDTDDEEDDRPCSWSWTCSSGCGTGIGRDLQVRVSAVSSYAGGATDTDDLNVMKQDNVMSVKFSARKPKKEKEGR